MKGLKLVYLLVMCISAVPVLATEIGPGPVSGDWYSSGNPYNVNGEINIPITDTLIIHPGVDVIFQGHYKLIVYGWLLAMGEEGDSVLFDAANPTTGWHGIRFEEAQDSSHLSYCIIQHGRATGTSSSDPDAWGGGIFCDGSNPVISHCSIRNNWAQWYDGGICLAYDSNPTIFSCDIIGNTATEEAGMCCYNYCNPTITNCTIADNTASGPTGGIYIATESNPTITNCVITGNTANAGGGIHIAYSSHPTITGCTITNNTVSNTGGGIRITTDCNPVITDCIIQDNTATSYHGGGIRITEYCNPTITNCTITGNFSGAYGGGMRVSENSNPTISGCTFTNNTADSLSGGLSVSYSSNPGIRDCDFIGNFARLGGGGIGIGYNSAPTIDSCNILNNSVDNAGGGIGLLYSGTAIISNCTVTGNVGGQDGGGIDCYGSSPQIMNCTITGNSANGGSGHGGGGIACTQGSQPLISNCMVSENTTNWLAGGIGCHLSNATIEYCNISGNSATDAGGLGINECSPTVRGCLITNNIAEPYDGGGVDIMGTSSNPFIENCTISGNTSSRYGSQIDLWEGASMNFRNNIVEGNTANELVRFYNSPVANFTYSDVYNAGSGGAFAGSIPTGLEVLTGTNACGDSCDMYMNVFLDPLFRDPTNGDFHLQDTTCGDPGYSHCIDAGDPTILDVVLDCWHGLGTNCSDMGAYGGDNDGWTGVREGDSNDLLIPQTFALYQNYPNPFNSSTILSYSLVRSCVVELVVYNVLGQRVTTLFSSTKQTGVHTVTWDASDVSSGIYFACLKSPNESSTVKMVLIK